MQDVPESEHGVEQGREQVVFRYVQQLWESQECNGDQERVHGAGREEKEAFGLIQLLFLSV